MVYPQEAAGHIAYVLGDGSIVGFHHERRCNPTARDGFGEYLVSFLKRKTPRKIDKLAAMMDTIEWVKHRDEPTQEDKDQYIRRRFHCPSYFLSKDHFDRLPASYVVPDFVLNINRWQRSRNERKCHEWQGLLAAFNNEHWRTWDFIQNGKLRHSLRGDSQEGQDWYYLIDFRRRTVEMRYNGIVGSVALVSFDTLIDDPDWLEMWEKQVEREIRVRYPFRPL